MSTIKMCVIGLDVWGNENEGYEINDSFKTNIIIEFEDEGTSWEETTRTEKNILNALIENGILLGTPENYSIDWETENDIAISEKQTGKPLINLENAAF